MRKGLFWLGLSIFTGSLVLLYLASYNVGAVPPVLYGAWLTAQGLRRRGQGGAAGRVSRGITLAFTGLMSLYLVVQGACVAAALSARSEPPKSRPDAIIVLGAGFWGDTLSAVLKERLDTALLLHRRYPSALLVLSGGKGFGENRTEASLMREYLLARGVPDSALLLETQAMDTVQNFDNSSRLLDARFGEGGYTGAFITSEFHLYRSRRLAVRAGLTSACYGADTPWYLLPAYLTRETVAILHDLLF